MKRVITYGTFDLLHIGHLNLLKRAKALGDYLIVGVTSDNYDRERGKLNVRKSLLERIDDLKSTGLVNEIIVEEYEGQKIDDIIKYEIDVFVIGSDWRGKFDYLEQYCSVVYLERTKGISSSSLRSKYIVRMGIIGSGRIAKRFIPESKYVNGVDVVGVYNPNINSAKIFSDNFELQFYTNDLDFFLSKVDAVYIASPHLSHKEYIYKSLSKGKHVLCEKPLVLSSSDAKFLYQYARDKELVLLEAIKTAFTPAFTHLISLLKSGVIGVIKDVDASFTKLTYGSKRELNFSMAGGSMTELSSYVLLPIIKLLGSDYKRVDFYSYMNKEIDLYTRGVIEYDSSVASFKVGLGVKTEGELIISGTNGYILVPAPWWKTEYFEVRYEDLSKTRKFFYKFDGDGLRYELNSFIQMIYNSNFDIKLLCPDESISIIGIIEKFRNRYII